jgi:hypothetical protein
MYFLFGHDLQVFICLLMQSFGNIIFCKIFDVLMGICISSILRRDASTLIRCFMMFQRYHLNSGSVH